MPFFNAEKRRSRNRAVAQDEYYSKRAPLSSNVSLRTGKANDLLRVNITENVPITELSSPNQRSEQGIVVQYYRGLIEVTNRQTKPDKKRKNATNRHRDWAHALQNTSHSSCLDLMEQCGLTRGGRVDRFQPELDKEF